MGPDELADEAFSEMGEEPSKEEKKPEGDYEGEALARKVRKAMESKDDAAAARYLKEFVQACK